MLNFEKKILSLGWVQKKLSEIVFSQYKIMLHLEKKYIHTGQTEMLCSHLGNAYSILRRLDLYGVIFHFYISLNLILN
jgi:hypothetical protein